MLRRKSSSPVSRIIEIRDVTVVVPEQASVRGVEGSEFEESGILKGFK